MCHFHKAQCPSMLSAILNFLLSIILNLLLIKPTVVARKLTYCQLLNSFLCSCMVDENIIKPHEKCFKYWLKLSI